MFVAMPGQNSAPVDHEPSFQPFFINAKPAEVVQLRRDFALENFREWDHC